MSCLRKKYLWVYVPRILSLCIARMHTYIHSVRAGTNIFWNKFRQCIYFFWSFFFFLLWKFRSSDVKVHVSTEKSYSQFNSELRPVAWKVWNESCRNVLCRFQIYRWEIVGLWFKELRFFSYRNGVSQGSFSTAVSNGPVVPTFDHSWVWSFVGVIISRVKPKYCLTTFCSPSNLRELQDGARNDSVFDLLIKSLF